MIRWRNKGQAHVQCVVALNNAKHAAREMKETVDRLLEWEKTFNTDLEGMIMRLVELEKQGKHA